MRAEDLESIIENNGVYILTKEQMQGILAQLNKEPEPINAVAELLLKNIESVSIYEDFRGDGFTCDVKIKGFAVTKNVADFLSYKFGGKCEEREELYWG